jgi:hypothetical protein
LLIAGLSCSFIIAGAVTRDVGRDLVIREWGVSQFWMPFVTGCLFVPLLVLSVTLLDQLPSPTAEDRALRSPRGAMSGSLRRGFLARFGLGFVLLLLAYLLLTAFRDFRDHYAAEIFDSLGLGDQRGIFSRTERWAMLSAISTVAFLNLFRDHRLVLMAVFGIIIAGFGLIGLSTLAFRGGHISGSSWMIWVGVGVYLAYVPYGAVLFERMMAASRLPGTSVFAIQLADGVGYTGSVLVQIFRDLFQGDADRLTFVIPYGYFVSLLGALLMLVSAPLVIRRASSIRYPAPRGRRSA